MIGLFALGMTTSLDLGCNSGMRSSRERCVLWFTIEKSEYYVAVPAAMILLNSESTLMPSGFATEVRWPG